MHAKAILFDGHEPQISLAVQHHAAHEGIPCILDAGSVHQGTLLLLDKVDYLVCSEKFALQYADNIDAAINQLAEISPVVVITLGERGLIWRRGHYNGAMPAPPIKRILDTTGAGDAFHGAFAAGIAAGLPWQDILRMASVAGGLCCAHLGARPGLPKAAQVQALLDEWQS